MLALVGAGATVAQGAAPRQASWVELASGRAGQYVWSVGVHRPRGATAGTAARPCLSVTALWRLSRFSYRRTRYRDCAQGPGRLTAADGPVIASAGQPSDSALPKITAVGMVFAPAVRRVRITLAGGRQKTIRLQTLSRVQARESGLGRLRYAAIVVRGTWCAERLVGQGASGKALWDSGTDQYACRARG